MHHSIGNPPGGEAPQPQLPPVDTQYDLQWVDLDDDLEEFGRMARGILGSPDPSPHIPGITPSHEPWVEAGDFPLDYQDATIPGATPISCTSPPYAIPAVTNLQPASTIPDGWGTDNLLWDLQTSVPVGYGGDGGIDPVPKAPRLGIIPLPLVTPDDTTGGHGKPYDITAFPGGGNNNHQSTQEWPDVSAQEAEASTSLAPAKPIITENNVQSESSTPATSSSRGGFDRRDNAKKKIQLFAEIREALGIPQKADEFETLRKIIEYFGKTIPTLEEPAAHLDKRQKRARRDALRHTYFKVLKDCVGPWNAERVYEAKVLNNALAAVTSQGRGAPGDEGYEGQGGHEGYGVFRFGN